MELIHNKFISVFFTKRLLHGRYYIIYFSEKEQTKALSHLSQIFDYCYKENPESDFTKLFLNYILNENEIYESETINIPYTLITKIYSLSSDVVIHAILLFNSLLSCKNEKILNYFIYDYISDQKYRKTDISDIKSNKLLTTAKKIQNKLSEYNKLFPMSPKPTKEYIDVAENSIMEDVEINDDDEQKQKIEFSEDSYKTPVKQRINKIDDDDNNFETGEFLKAIFSKLKSYYTNTQKENFVITEVYII